MKAWRFSLIDLVLFTSTVACVAALWGRFVMLNRHKSNPLAGFMLAVAVTMTSALAAATAGYFIRGRNHIFVWGLFGYAIALLSIILLTGFASMFLYR